MSGKMLIFVAAILAISAAAESVSPSKFAAMATKLIAQDLNSAGDAINQIRENWQGVNAASDATVWADVQTLYAASSKCPVIGEIIAMNKYGSSYEMIDLEYFHQQDVLYLKTPAETDLTGYPVQRLENGTWVKTGPAKKTFTDYNPFNRTWYQHFNKTPNTVVASPAYALVSQPQAVLYVGTTFDFVNKAGTRQVGSLASILFTGSISKQLNKLTGQSIGSYIVAYDANTCDVVGVSWGGETLIDSSMYDANDANPTAKLKTLDDLDSQVVMKFIIARFGGNANLCRKEMSSSLRENWFFGYKASVVDVPITSAEGMNIRAIIATPTMPDVAATEIVEGFQQDIATSMGAVENLIKTVAPNGLPTPNGTDAATPNTLKGFYNTLKDEKTISIGMLGYSQVQTKTSDGWAAMWMSTKFSPPLVISKFGDGCKTSSNLDVNGWSTTQVPNTVPNCEYAVYERSWWNTLTAKTNTWLASPAIALVSDGADAAIFVGKSYNFNRGAATMLGTGMGIMYTSQLTQQLQRALEPYVGMQALVYEAATGNVVAVSWTGEALVDNHVYGAGSDPTVTLKSLKNINSNTVMRNVLDALGDQQMLTKDTIPEIYANAHVADAFVSIRELNIQPAGSATSISGLNLRMILVNPVTPFTITDMIGAKISADLSSAAADVDKLASNWDGINPADTQPALVALNKTTANPLFAEVLAADNSIPNSYAMVDIDYYVRPYPVAYIRNNTKPCLTDYKLDPTTLSTTPVGTESCNYNPFGRTWYKALDAADGELTATPASALFGGQAAMIVVGKTYTTSAGKTGAIGGMVFTSLLSEHLRKTIPAGSGAVGLTYEVATGNVIAVSWDGESLIDTTNYNMSSLNPDMTMKTVDTIDSNWKMSWAIRSLGGSTVLCQKRLPSAIMTAFENGNFAVVKEISVPQLPSLKIRSIVVVPMTASKVADTTARWISGDLATAVQSLVLGSRDLKTAPNAPLSDSTNEFLTNMMPHYIRSTPLVSLILAGDTSVKDGYGLACITNTFGYPIRFLVRNSSYEVRENFQIMDPSDPLGSLKYVSNSSSYDVTKRFFYTGLVDTTEITQLPAAASASSRKALIFIGKGYTVGETKGMVSIGLSSQTISKQLRFIFSEIAGAFGLIFEVGTSNVVGVSWNGEELVDFTNYNTSQDNPDVTLKTIDNIASNAPMRKAIDALGGSALLAQAVIPKTVRDLWVEGYTVCVRDVSPGQIQAGARLRMITLVPVSARTLAASAANKLAGDIESAADLIQGVAQAYPVLSTIDYKTVSTDLYAIVHRNNALLDELYVMDNSATYPQIANMVEADVFDHDAYEWPIGYHMNISNCLVAYDINTGEHSWAPYPALDECNYDPFKKSFYTQLNKDGSLTASSVMAKFGHALVEIGMRTSGRMAPNGQSIIGSVGGMISTDTVSKELANIVASANGALAAVFDANDGTVFGVSWPGEKLHNDTYGSKGDKFVKLTDLDELVSSPPMAKVIKQYGGKTVLCQKTVPPFQGVLDGYVATIQDIQTPTVANLNLRLIMLVPVDPALLGQFAARMISQDIREAVEIVQLSGQLWTGDFHGLANSTNTFLSTFAPVLARYNPLVSLILAGDTSIPGSYALGCVTDTFGEFRFLVKNSSYEVRENFRITNIADPMGSLEYVSNSSSYDVTKRFFYTGLVNSTDAITQLPAAASASSGKALIVMGYGYRVPGTAMEGMFSVGLTTQGLSKQLNSVYGAWSNSYGLIYEVETGNVIAVSWKGEKLVDYTNYNTSQDNPDAVLKTVNNINSAAPVRRALDALNTNGALTASVLDVPAQWIDGYYTSVVEVVGAPHEGITMRMVSLVPVAPSGIANMVANHVASDFEGLAVDVMTLAATFKPIDSYPTANSISEMYTIVDRQKFVDELYIFDNSGNGFGFIDVETLSATGPTAFIHNGTTTPSNCLLQYGLDTKTATITTQKSKVCNFNPFSKPYYTRLGTHGELSADNVAAVPGYNVAAINVAMKTALDRPHKGRTISGSAGAYVTTATLTKKVKEVTAGISGAVAMMFQYTTGNVVAVSWEGQSLNTVVTIESLNSNAAMADVIATITPAVLKGTTIPATVFDSLANGYFVSVRDVPTPTIKALGLRLVVLTPMTPSNFANVASEVIVNDLRVGIDHVVNTLYGGNWQGIPENTDEFLVEHYPFLLKNREFITQIAVADTSIPAPHYAFVDVSANYGETMRWLVTNSTVQPAGCRHNYEIKDVLNPVKGLVPAPNPKKCDYDALTRYWYKDIVAAKGQMVFLPAKASAGSGTANAFVGASYVIPNKKDASKNITGAFAVGISTASMSNQLAKVFENAEETFAAVYEVATGAVIGNSWGEILVDKSQYDPTDREPIISVKKLNALSNTIIPNVVNKLGGLSNFMNSDGIPANLLDAVVDNGNYQVSVRNVLALEGMNALRILIVKNSSGNPIQPTSTDVTQATDATSTATPPTTETPRTPAPTLPISFGFRVLTPTARRWYNVRSNLRSLICSSRGCPGSSSDDEFRIPQLDSSYESTEFWVIANMSWEVYAAIGLPQAALEKVNIANITGVGVDDDLAARGPNQVMITSLTKYTSWVDFTDMRYDIMRTIDAPEKNMSAVNCSCMVDENDRYNCTWIVSLSEVSHQVEVASIDWAYFNQKNVRTSIAREAVLYPLGVDLDQTTANSFVNRAEFSFVYKYSGSYQSYDEFSEGIAKVLNNTVKSTDLQLVGATVTPNVDNSLNQSFIVSFPEMAQRTAVMTLYKKSPADLTSAAGFSSYYFKWYNATAVASPAPIQHETDAPPPATKKADKDSGNKTTIIIIVVVAVIVLLVIIVIVAKVAGGGKKNTSMAESEGETPLEEVVSSV